MSLTLEDISVAVSDGPDLLQILGCVSLRVEPGQVVAITGASGSGKSTLLAVAGLLRRPDAGSLRIGERELSGASRRDRTKVRRDDIGLVLQSSSLFPSLTAVEQVELVAHMAGRLDRAARARAVDLLGGVGLGDRLGHRPPQTLTEHPVVVGEHQADRRSHGGRGSRGSAAGSGWSSPAIAGSSRPPSIPRTGWSST